MEAFTLKPGAHKKRLREIFLLQMRYRLEVDYDLDHDSTDHQNDQCCVCGTVSTPDNPLLFSADNTCRSCFRELLLMLKTVGDAAAYQLIWDCADELNTTVDPTDYLLPVWCPCCTRPNRMGISSGQLICSTDMVSLPRKTTADILQALKNKGAITPVVTESDARYLRCPNCRSKLSEYRKRLKCERCEVEFYGRAYYDLKRLIVAHDCPTPREQYEPDELEAAGGWEPNAYVNVGDLVRSANCVQQKFMLCVWGGRTGRKEPEWPEPGKEISERIPGPYWLVLKTSLHWRAS